MSVRLGHCTMIGALYTRLLASLLACLLVTPSTALLLYTFHSFSHADIDMDEESLHSVMRVCPLEHVVVSVNAFCLIDSIMLVSYQHGVRSTKDAAHNGRGAVFDTTGGT